MSAHGPEMSPSGAEGASALEALLAALSSDDEAEETALCEDLPKDAAQSWKRIAQGRRAAQSPRPAAPEPATIPVPEKPQTPVETASAPQPLPPEPSPPVAQQETAQPSAAAHPEAQQPTHASEQPTAPPHPFENASRRQLRAPRLGLLPRDADGYFCFNSYFDEIGVVFESEAAPGEPPAPERIGLQDGGSGPIRLPLDRARARRVLEEAQDAECSPEEVLAAAVDLYFTVLDRAGAHS